MTRRRLDPTRVRIILLLLGVLALASSCGWNLWDNPMTTVRPRSDFGQLIDGLFMLISWTTLVIFIAVEGALLYACWRFRDRPGAPIPRQIHGHTPLELSWTVAFALVLLVIGIPT
ncbi:MAG TPA: cytochrome c oxidase subunit II transmembrane domain-containing protein, partial [Candidatus Methylomirabilis sp.]|nr:cytochrome c oxidase subunit II transmembrane domain-containing protein [Candidatus Methylomirabilis sp.]